MEGTKKSNKETEDGDDGKEKVQKVSSRKVMKEDCSGGSQEGMISRSLQITRPNFALSNQMHGIISTFC
jgi:hypothetical protein